MNAIESAKRECPMDERERFSKLYDVILDIFRSYMANFVWTVGLFALATGWFISSESSRAFIQSSFMAFFSGILVVAIIGLIHTVSCVWYYRRSRDKIAEMTTAYQGLNPLPFREYEIRTATLLANLLVVWTMVAGLIAFLVAAHTS